MNYAIETLKIELYKLKEAQRNEDCYSVHPQYQPLSREWKADMISIMKAIEILKEYKEGLEMRLEPCEKCHMVSDYCECDMQAAHRQGWEQCQREAKDKAEAFAHAGKLCCMEKADKIKDAIASMDYKGAEK